MNLRRLVLVAIVILAAGGVSQAFDSVKTTKGTMLGQVRGMSPVQIRLEQRSGGVTKKVKIPVNQVRTIFFKGEPVDLKTAKTHMLAGRYAKAQKALERIEEEPKRVVIRQDIEFYKALCAAKLALVLKDSGEIIDAGRMMRAFADANGGSYHYFDASEIVGDLLVAIKQYGRAADYYARLEKAPWTDYKMRAGVATGKTLLAQGKTQEAQNAFDRVIAAEAKGDLAQGQRTVARLGKASALIAAQKPDEAIPMVEEILKTADVEDVPLMARAYNVLGNAYRQTGDVKRALLAFLHVDVLYSSVPDAHAEALANLADLWERVHKSDRAARARKTLQDEYQHSPWARPEERK